MRSPCLKCKVHLSGENKAGHPKCEICDDRLAYVQFINNQEHDFPVMKMGGAIMTENNATYGETDPAPEAPATKVCRRCNIEKEIEKFSKHPQTKDGRDATCKACKNELAKERNGARRAGTAPPVKPIAKKKTEAKTAATTVNIISMPTDRPDPYYPSCPTDPSDKKLILDLTDFPEIFDEISTLSRRMIRPIECQAIFMLREYMEAFGEFTGVVANKVNLSEILKAAQ